MDKIESIVKRLKKIIDNNGYNYLKNNPYEIYTQLIKEKGVDRKIASALFCLMANGTFAKNQNLEDKDAIINNIKEDSGFNDEMANVLSEVIINLYSKSNKDD